MLLGKSRGQVVKAEDSQLRGCGFKPSTEQTIFNALFILIQSVELKYLLECYKLSGIVAWVVIPIMGKLTMRTVR
jgi:hypothetical protein